MKNKILIMVTAVILLLPKINFGQAPALGTTANFVLFTSVGAVSNTGISQLTGNVGSNSGSSTGFGNVNGVMENNNGVTGLCAADLTLAYNQLNSTVPTFFPASLLGNGQTLNAGVYSIAGATTLNLDLTLDGQGNSSAVFIFQIQGPFSANANSKVKLINGAKACNVFWKIEGLVSMAAATTMRGTIIANNAAINMSTNDTLEGRALSTAGAITIDGTLAYKPIGCGSAVLTGPLAPTLNSIACYTLFSSIGPVTNAGVTHVTGDIGSDNGTTTGFDPLLVVGAIHGTPDGSTALCSSDLLQVYNYLNTLPYDIELLYPAQFGNNLVLTPHTYRMNSAATFTDTLYLNAEGNPNAVFVIQINGALATSTYSKVKLINGTQAKNVFWKVEGAVSINDYSVFRGTIICNNGAISMTTGVYLDGRALTTTGALNTAAITAIMPPGCGASATSPIIITEPSNQIVCAGDSAGFSVTAVGTGLTYQWRKGSVNLINGGNISGATSSVLTINPVTIADTAFNYNVIVSGTTAPNDTSNNVSLTLTNGVAITNEPSGQIVCPGDSAFFTVAATGTGLMYQWRRGNVNLINGLNVSGANSSTLSIDPTSITDTAFNYNVIVTGSCGSDTSVFASLAFTNGISISSEPLNQLVCIGDSAFFTVAAPGTGLSYQWRKGNINLINGLNISGANSSTLSIDPTVIADTAFNYNVIVTGSCGIDTSIFVSLYFNNGISISSEPSNQVLCLGDSAFFTVTAPGTGLSYQWRRGNINLINGLNISGANSSTLSIDPTVIADTAFNYNVIVSGSCGSDTSVFVSLMLNTGVNITAQPANQTSCSGSAVSFATTAGGTVLSYQWRKGNIILINGGNISGATSATLTINPVNITDTAFNYNVIVNGVCGNDTSVFVSLSLDSTHITTEPVNQSGCAGSSISFSATASGTGLTYQWRKGSVNLINGGNISGVSSSVLTINPISSADASLVYNVVVSGSCGNDTSVNVSLTVNSLPVAIAGSNSPVCTGSSIILTAQTVAGATYAWSGPAGYSSPLQNPVILLASSADAGNYSLTVTQGGCSSAISTVPVAVTNCNADLSVTKTVSNMTPFYGSSVVFTITVTNNSLNNATGVAVNEMLQSGYTYVSSSATTGIYDPSTGVWTIGTMNGNATATLSITVNVFAGGNYVNNAIVYGNEWESDMTNNNASVETSPTDFFLPEGFSPNDDGINDRFVIRGIENYPENTFVIFNRWGDKVFEASPYTNTWDGKCEKGLRVGGDELPVGTYFYVLDLGDGSKIFKGTIYLNR